MKTGWKGWVLAMAALHVGAALAEPLVQLTPDKNEFAVGNTYSVQVMMEGFPQTEGGGVSLSFNPAMLQVTKVQVDSGTWTFVNRNGEIDNQAGLVSDIVFSNFSGVSGNAAIATIEFKAIKPGRSQLTLAGSTLNPFAGGGQPIEVAFGNAQVMIKKR
jgi:hypothetical protein